MGKGKGSSGNDLPSEAYQRMSFLYLASMSVTDTSSSLAAYLGHLAKQVNQKIVGKMHPYIKRTLCKACSNPLTDKTASTKLLPFKKKRNRGKAKKVRKKQENTNASESAKPLNLEKADEEKLNVEKNSKISKNMILNKIYRPNRLKTTCGSCGYERQHLQRPGYKLWIENSQALDIS